MCVYMCMYVCMYVCMYACMCVCMHACVYVLYVCMHVCMCVCICYVQLLMLWVSTLHTNSNTFLSSSFLSSSSPPVVTQRAWRCWERWPQGMKSHAIMEITSLVTTTRTVNVKHVRGMYRENLSMVVTLESVLGREVSLLQCTVEPPYNGHIGSTMKRFPLQWNLPMMYTLGTLKA